MKLAVLFWCYKNPELCKDRLRHIRRDNPDIQIFVLFGGNPDEAVKFESALKPESNDFYVFDQPPPPGAEDMATHFRGGLHWKYVYGDLQITAWYRDRGQFLEWDTVVLLQWDMLVFGKIQEVFKSLKKDEILLSGLRPVKDVEERWSWVRKDQPEERAMYLEFLQYVQQKFGYKNEPMCCLAIVLCLPRVFLEPYSKIEKLALGFLEYKLPIYAQIFGTNFCTEHPFEPWWPALKRSKLGTTLRARLSEISRVTILFNLLRANGARVFHPYWKNVSQGALNRVWQLKSRLREKSTKENPTTSRTSASFNSKSNSGQAVSQSVKS